MPPPAKDVQELRPLLELCKSGRLFEVREWIAAGKPISLADDAPSRSMLHIPLHVALLSGFHSLVQVLLEAGAPTCNRGYPALHYAVELRRTDLAELLLKHGAAASDVSLCDAIESKCDPDFIDALLGAGANLIDEDPVARGLINRIWETLKVVKRHIANVPELALQVNTALRHHAHEGNAKWVSLTLWAGGDPLARGPYDLDQDWYSEEFPGENAIELAASRGHIEVLQQGKIRSAIRNSAGTGDGLLIAACGSSNSEVIETVIRAGHSPRSLQDGGTAAIASIVDRMVWDLTLDHVGLGYYGGCRPNDSATARSRMGVLHSLLAHGATWRPEGKDALARVRQSLLKLAPPFSMEFAWLMKRFGAARRADVNDLVRTDAMRRHLSEQKVELARLLGGIPEDLPAAPTAGSKSVLLPAADRAKSGASGKANELSDASQSHSP